MVGSEGMRRGGVAMLVGLIAILIGWRVCSTKEADKELATGGASPAASTSAEDRGGLSAPIAAARHPNGDVLVAGLDVGAGGIRVQRIDANDRIVEGRIVLGGVAWTNDADVKISAPSKDGAAVRWRGLRGGKLVKQLVMLGADLVPKGAPSEVGGASCATRDAVWSSDGARAISRGWDGSSTKIDLPKDEEASLLCGQTSAFALLDSDERTTLLPLGPRGPSGAAGAGEGRRSPITVLRESELGDDEQREVAEYTVGDDVGVVRLGASGTVVVRELGSAGLGALRKLKTMIPKDDDLVAVDASPKLLAIVYTEDASATCPSTPNDTSVATKVLALRVDRQTGGESTVELSPGKCGHEIGPFFTGAVGDGVSVAWPERVGGAGHARAPIAGLAHAVVAPSGDPTLARIDQAADALVDAGCDGARCYAVALARHEGADAMLQGFAKVLRY